MATTTSGGPPTSNALTPCDVFALACELRNQLHAIEDRQEKVKDYAEQLKNRSVELQHVLDVFQLVENKEKATTKTMHEELTKIGREAFGPSWTWEPDLVSSPESAVAVENASHDDEPPRPASRNQVHSAMRFFFKGTTPGQRAQLDELPAPRSKKRPMVDENAPPTGRSSSFGKAKARSMKRIFSEKIKRKASEELKSMPRKIRRVSKSSEPLRLVRRKPVPQLGSSSSPALVPVDTSGNAARGLGFGSFHNAQIA